MDIPISPDLAKRLLQKLRDLSAENEALQQQVAHLQSQLDLLSGKTLNPELARSWLPGLKRCKGWNQLVVGRYGYCYLDGNGLKGLISSLLKEANPGKVDWYFERTRETLLRRGQPELADALTKLTRRLSGRLPLVIEASLLIYGDQAVTMLSTRPAEVVQRLVAEVQRSDEVWRSNAAREARRQELAYLGGGNQQQARQVLGVGADATADEIKAAYRQLAKQHHPDAGGDPERFHQIQQAYELLQQPAAVTA